MGDGLVARYKNLEILELAIWRKSKVRILRKSAEIFMARAGIGFMILEFAM